jgi:hypothetical protein
MSSAIGGPGIGFGLGDLEELIATFRVVNIAMNQLVCERNKMCKMIEKEAEADSAEVVV